VAQFAQALCDGASVSNVLPHFSLPLPQALSPAANGYTRGHYGGAEAELERVTSHVQLQQLTLARAVVPTCRWGEGGTRDHGEVVDLETRLVWLLAPRGLSARRSSRICGRSHRHDG
jgi:hypothetical protein